MDQRLNIIFSGDTTQLESSIKQVTEDLNRLEKELADLTTNSINTTVDSSQIDALVKKIDLSKAKLAELSLRKVFIGADSTQVTTEIEKLKTKLTGLQANVGLDVSTGDLEKLNAEIKKTTFEINALQKIKLEINTTESIAQIADLEKRISALKSLTVNPKISVQDLASTNAEIDKLRARLQLLKSGVTVTFSGDTTNLGKTISQLEAQLKRFEAGIKTTSGVDSFLRLNRAIDATKVRLDALRNTSTAFNRSFSSTSGAAQTATFTMTNFGRVLQDLPFGIIGVANNLNPLAESFRSLQLQAKAAGTSVGRELLNSLKGFGGFALGLSAVTAAAQFAVVGLSAFTRGFGSTGKAAEDASEKIRKSSEIIDDATASVQGDIAKVNALADAFRNTDSFDRQKRILEELKGVSKAYFGDLEAGKVTFEQITKAANDYTNALVAQAVVKGFTDEISKISGELSKQKGKLKEVAAAKADYDQQLSKVDPSARRAGKSTLEFEKQLGVVTELKREFIRLQDELRVATGEALKFKLPTGGASDIKDTTDEIIARARQFVKEFGDSFVLPDLSDSFFTSKEQLLKGAKDLLESVRKFIAGDQNALKIRVSADVEFGQIKETITRNVNELNKLIGTIDKEVTIKISKEGDVKKIIEDLQKIKGVEVPITIDQQGNVKEIQKQLQSLKGVDIPIKITGDVQKVVDQLSKIKNVDVSVKANVDEVVKQLSSIQDKEIVLTISQDGDVKKIAEQLTKLKGVEIPVVIEQQGDVNKIVKQLQSLKGVDIPVKITGDVKETIDEISKIEDVNISAKLNEGDALKKIDELTKGRELPIIINQKDLIFQVSKAIDGAIQVTKTKQIIIPVVTQADLDLAESLTEEAKAGVHISEDIIKKFFADIKRERNVFKDAFSIPPEVTKQFDELQEKFIQLGIRGKEAFTKISFSSKDGTNQLQAFNDGITAARKELEKLLKQSGRKLNFEIAVEIAQTDTGKTDAAGNKILKDISNSAKEAALSINETLTPAFQDLFNAILEGKSPLQAFFKSLTNSINQVIQRLIAAAVQAAILSAISGGNAGSFGEIFTNILGVGKSGGAANFSAIGSIGQRAGGSLSASIRGTDLVFTLAQGQRQIGG